MKLSIKTIKGKILIGNIFLVFFPVLSLAIFSYNTYVDSIEAKTKAQMDVVVKSINVYFDQFFNELNMMSQLVINDNVIQAALSQPPAQNMEYTLENLNYEIRIFKYFENLLRTKPLVDSILIYGNNDMYYFYHQYKTWNPNIDTRKEEWYQKVVEGNGKWVLTHKRIENQLYSLQFPNIITKNEVFTYARVIKNNQTLIPIGVMAINIRGDFVDEISKNIDVGGAINIKDNQMNMILKTQLKDGEHYISVEKKSDVTGLTLNYNYSTKELYKEISLSRRWMIVICILLLIVSMVFALAISSRISKPLKVLRDSMKQVSEGNFRIIPFSRTDDEVQEMYQSYNIMVNETKNLISEISIKEQERMKNELYVIQVSINPHFIYNTLNCIRWAAMLEKNNFIADMISSFIYLLKMSVGRRKEYITLKEEMEFVAAYSKLMKLRYNNFSLNISVQDGIENCLILPFLIQPLVENAIFHGIAPLKDRQGVIGITIRKKGYLMEAVITDNGVGIESSRISKLSEDKSGLDENMLKIGISSVYKRLKIQYHDKGSFKIDSECGVGTIIAMSWPAKWSEEAKKYD